MRPLTRIAACAVWASAQVLIAYPSIAEDGSPGDHDALGTLGAATIGPGKTREEEGANIHDKQTEDRLELLERNQGQAERLRQEQIERRNFHENKQ